MKIILLGDVHARDDIPACRTDDYLAAQSRKFAFLKQKALVNNAIIVQAGDLLNKWKPNPELLTMCIKEMPFMYTIAGNHDLPQHNHDLFYKSGLATLEAAGTIEVLREPKFFEDDGVCVCPFPWNAEMEPNPHEGWKTLAVIHKLIWAKPPFPGADVAGNAKAVLRKMKGYDIILSGDNHEYFEVERGGGYLVNPGSMMRMTAAQQDFQPRFFMWDTETGDLDEFLFEIDVDAVSVRHVEVEKEKNERIESFVASISEEVDLGLDFIANINKAISSSSVSQKTADKVREVLDECAG